MKPEEQIRVLIDEQLTAAGWMIQSYKEANLFATDGVVLWEVPTVAEPSDYTLFWKRRAVGIVEAKPEGTSLVGVSEQTEKYTAGLPAQLKKAAEPLPFGSEVKGHKVRFRDLRDLDNRSQTVFLFHRPATLGAWTAQTQTLDAEHLQGQQARQMLADLVTLVRCATGQTSVFEPYGTTVPSGFEVWLAAQEAQQRSFSAEQRRWLTLICVRTATDLKVQEAGLNELSFNELGGLTRVRQVFGETELRALLTELTTELAA